jgi:Cu(I)/Ag(I) efflux system protein CusF
VKTSKPYFIAAALAISTAAFAQSMSMPASGMSTSKPQASVADEYTNAEIRKIDKNAGKVTLKHGEIKNLGMQPMAMEFEAKDKKMLDKFKVGDKVRFRAVSESGKFVLRDIERAK